MKTVKLLLPNNQMLTFDNPELFESYNWENFKIGDEVFLEGMESLEPLYVEDILIQEVILSFKELTKKPERKMYHKI